MFDSATLQKKLIKLTNNKKFLIAYSGGMDSHVLLHSMQQNPEFQLRAVHVHHGLSKKADQWVEHCRSICSNLNIEYIVKYISAHPNNKTKKHSPEAIARELRYQEFAKLLQADECLLTAHHADDQAETVLKRLFEGARLENLAGMCNETIIDGTKFWRPFLTVPKQEPVNA